MAIGSGDPRKIQYAVDFLSALERQQIDQADSGYDYETILTLARQRGFELDEAALNHAFVLMMRARVISSR
jgi:hypothetical protein